jgi:hypothetical protein
VIKGLSGCNSAFVCVCVGVGVGVGVHLFRLSLCSIYPSPGRPNVSRQRRAFKVREDNTRVSVPLLVTLPLTHDHSRRRMSLLAIWEPFAATVRSLS